MNYSKVVLTGTLVIMVMVLSVGLSCNGSYTSSNDGHHTDDMGHHENGEETDHSDTTQMEPSGSIENGVRIVTVQARQFEFVPSTIIVNEGDDMQLEITSEDVTHGFDLEGFGIDRRLEPHKTEIITFSVPEAGTYHFHCSVYCGLGHKDMHGELIVRSASE